MTSDFITVLQLLCKTLAFGEAGQGHVDNSLRNFATFVSMKLLQNEQLKVSFFEAVVS